MNIKDIEKQQVTVGIKVAPDAQGLPENVIRFIASTMDEDRDGDTIDPRGILTRFFALNPVFQPYHDYNTLPAGKVVNWFVEGDAWIIDVQFPTEQELRIGPESHVSEQAKLALDVFRWYRAGYLSAVSIGFLPIPGQVFERTGGGYHFAEVEVMEVSGVPVPSNRFAVAIERYLDDGELKRFDQWITRELSDNPESVALTASDAVVRAGRVLSAEHYRKLRSAHAAIGEVLDKARDPDDDASKSAQPNGEPMPQKNTTEPTEPTAPSEPTEAASPSEPVDAPAPSEPAETPAAEPESDQGVEPAEPAESEKGVFDALVKFSEQLATATETFARLADELIAAKGIEVPDVEEPAAPEVDAPEVPESSADDAEIALVIEG